MLYFLSYGISFIVSFTIVFIIIPPICQLATKKGILDCPNSRKIHKIALPRLGGVAIFSSFCLTTLLGYIILQIERQGAFISIVGISIGSAIIVIIGVMDDIYSLRAINKVLGQLASVLVVIPFGFVISDLDIPFIGLFHISLIPGIFLTVFWVVGIINAINLIDGMDGLAGGVAFIISCALFIVSMITKQLEMAFICIVIAGAIAGFLYYNFHPAVIFMGDCGSMFLGFTLSVVSVKLLFQNSDITASSVIPMLIFGFPILDSTWAILRRLAKRKSPFHADMGHFHHRLLNLGLTQRRSAILIYLVTLLSGAAGIIISYSNSDKLAVMICATMLLVGIGMVLILNHISPQGSA